jgi:hypothetical protein
MALTLYGGSGNASISSDSANLSLTTQSNVVNVASSTGSIVIPAGTTAERPTGVNGMLRYNTSNAAFEGFANSSWGAIGGSAGGGGLTWSTVQTANFTAVTSTAYAVNTTTNPITVTLPASPAAGAQVQLTDYARTWAANAVTLNRNGANIAGSAANIDVNTNGASVALVYIDTTQGWIAFNGFPSSPIGTYTAQYLVVAGGGGGGPGAGGGGGGAGGVLAASTTLFPGTAYTVTVGAGGAGAAASGGIAGNNGVNTSFGNVTAIAGGAGGSSFVKSGSSGGSGGGGAGDGGPNSGSAGTSGQGNTGGTGYGTGIAGGGGGGAGAVGGSAGTGAVANGGNGGIGVQSSLSGAAVYYGGGGGGSVHNASGGVGGTGGSGGGANGVAYQDAAPAAATANTGGGGGGAAGRNGISYGASGAGGSGIVIVSYLGSQRGTGGTVTTSGGYTIHTFTSSGTYTA